MNLLLRLEHAAIAVVALTAYSLLGGSWWLFAALILVPDVSFAAYLLGPRIGAIGYNIAHSWISAALLAAIAWLSDWSFGYEWALILSAHIAIDRAMGYGLKYETGFTDTHLGKIGRSKAAHG